MIIENYLRWGLVTLPIIAWTCWASHTHKLRSTASVFPLKLYSGTDSRTGSTIDHKSWTPITIPKWVLTNLSWGKRVGNVNAAQHNTEQRAGDFKWWRRWATFQFVEGLLTTLPCCGISCGRFVKENKFGVWIEFKSWISVLCRSYVMILSSIMIIKKTSWNRRIRRCRVDQTQMDVI